jgi:AcrR family transcriptional regulator
MVSSFSSVTAGPDAHARPVSPALDARGDARRAIRRDVERNYQRVLDAAREVFGESGAEASIEEIAARAGVGIGTVYRRFASKDALIDELLRLSIEALLRAAGAALAAPPQAGLEQYLRACGREFASHARYADLLLTRPADPAARARLREAVEELTARAVRAGAVHPSVTAIDVMALIWGMRGLVQATADLPPDAWQRYLSIHLAGLRFLGGANQPPRPLDIGGIPTSLLPPGPESHRPLPRETAGLRSACGQAQHGHAALPEPVGALLACVRIATANGTR